MCLLCLKWVIAVVWRSPAHLAPAFPWRGMAGLADGRALPPKDGDVWRIDCSRFEKMGRHGEVLDPCVGWTWNRHGHYDSLIPEVFPYVTFSGETVK